MSQTSNASDVVARAELFDGLPREAVDAIARLTELQSLEEGDEVYGLGDPASAVYIVKSGRVRFSLGVGNRASAQTILEAGSAFGWAALIGESPRRVATATCLEDSVLLAIDGKRLTAYFDGDTASGYRVMRRLADRISRDLLSALTT
ncbi:MAG: Crp/Fnr family transcriptional regulator [Hyphomicrobiaceae bacterium]